MTTKTTKTTNQLKEITFNLDELFTEHKTKSNIIRFLHNQGYTRSQISKFLNIRYQHVRNVLVTPLKQIQPK